MTSTEPLAGAFALPDGTLIRGRGQREPLPAGPQPDFGLYLGKTASLRDKILGRTVWRPDWPAVWVDWPDFGTPRDDDAAAAAIEGAYLLARAGQRVEVACGSGTGRTGTVLACMAILAGHPGEDALTWIRQNYRPHAVETLGQRRWIRWYTSRARSSAEPDDQRHHRDDQGG